MNFSRGAVLEELIYSISSGRKKKKKSIMSVLLRKTLPNLSYHHQIKLENY